MATEPVVVVGAGVIGLSVAVRLAETGRRVEVVARELPLETTSAVAAAIWYPYLIEPPARALAWAGRSLDEFVRLAGRSGRGVMLRRGCEYLREPAPRPWWAELMPDLEQLGSVPAPFEAGWSFVTPVVEMPVYLRWLQARLQDLGGSIRRADLATLPSDAPWVVNCAGLGASRLVGDNTVTPVRGQVIVLSQVGLESWALDGAGLTYVVPRPDDIIVGGTDEVGSWDLTPDLGVAAQILARATALVPTLKQADVLGHRVGLRPARPAVRLEVEERHTGQRVVHCYGHGGAGVTVSWGCAEEVVALVNA